MTTIVYFDGIVAADSRVTDSDGTIINDDFNKVHKENGVVFVRCGSTSDLDSIQAGYFGNDHDKKSNAGAIICDNGKVYVSGINKDDGFWKTEITNRPYAIGSGADHAWTALDLGCNAKEAVKMAIKRNTWSGGKVRTYRVK